MDLALYTAKTRNCKIILMQEPNQKLASKEKICDKQNNTVIKICDTNLNVKSYGCGDNYTYVVINDVTIINCYISPNKNLDEFKTAVTEIENRISINSNISKKFLIAGDLNAKSTVWGGKRTDSRGNHIIDTMCENNMVVVNNVASVPTFQGPRGDSYIDITVCSVALIKQVSKWQVLDEESLSDHKYITYQVEEDTKSKGKLECPVKKNGYILTVDGIENVLLEMEKIQHRNASWEAEEWDLQIKKCCELHLKKKGTRCNDRTEIYWWNNTLTRLKTEVNKARRMWQHGKRIRDPNAEWIQDLGHKYWEIKNKLKKEIISAKKTAWKDLMEDLNNDRWGLGYKIVTKKIGCAKLNVKMAVSEVEGAIKKLFPRQPRIIWEMDSIQKEDPEGLFTEIELQKSILTMKNKKAPGIDGVQCEVLKRIATETPQQTLNCLNFYWEKGMFPRRWKVTKLILLEKGKVDVDGTKSYRPICLLNSVAKLYEKLIKQRIERVLEEKNILSDQQFGFRTGLSTIHALLWIQNHVDKLKCITWKNRPLCLQINIDIKNAFNSARWDKVIEEIEKWCVSARMINSIKSYLHDRYIVDQAGNWHEVTCGVPQGSVLGPILWNIFYNQILKIKLPEGVQLVAYADDLAIIVTKKKISKLKWLAEYSMGLIIRKLEDMGLEVATQKTEMVMLVGGYNTFNFEILVEGCTLRAKQQIKHLGVYVDHNYRMTKHVEIRAAEAMGRINALRKLMPNFDGPGYDIRKVYAGVGLSIILYGWELYERAFKHRKYRDIANRLNRRLALGVCRAYKSTSTTALEVIAKMPPIDLKIGKMRNQKEGMEVCLANKLLLSKWQSRWRDDESDTRKVIPMIEAWHQCEWAKPTRELSICISGHGPFATHRMKIKRDNTNTCKECKENYVDTAGHMLFECAAMRSKPPSVLSGVKSVAGAVEKMLTSEAVWNESEKFIIMAVREKEMMERCREKNSRESSN